jgi:hypothetical protein
MAATTAIDARPASDTRFFKDQFERDHSRLWIDPSISGPDFRIDQLFDLCEMLLRLVDFSGLIQRHGGNRFEI